MVCREIIGKSFRKGFIMKKMTAICVVAAMMLGIISCVNAGIITYEVTASGGDAYSISLFASGYNVTELTIPGLSVVNDSDVSGVMTAGSVSSTFDSVADGGSVGSSGSIDDISGQVSDPTTIFVTDALYTFVWTGTSSTNSIDIELLGPMGLNPDSIIKYNSSGSIKTESISGTDSVPLPTPEPATMVIFGLGGLILNITRRKV